MTLQPRDWTIIPEQTAQIARAAFPKGNIYMMMPDELGVLYSDSDFVTLFRADCGQPPISPAQLALITIMQFAEGLSDRQTADAVRARLDWKYALGLELTDPGFDFSVLSEFRSRLIKSGREGQLLEQMLRSFVQKGLINARGKARTDSTHVLAAIHQLNRIECVAETLRHALNELPLLFQPFPVYSLTQAASCFDSTTPSTTFSSHRSTAAPNNCTVQAALCQTGWSRRNHLSSCRCLWTSTLSLHWSS